MKTRTHRTIFWASIAAALLGIIIFTQTESWAAVGLTMAGVIIASFAGESGHIYDEEAEA